MAPAAGKSKLAQTRLKTPQRKPPGGLPSSSLSSKSRTRAKPNQSILTFFKKTPAREESLFVGGEEGRDVSCGADVDGDGYGAGDVDGVGDAADRSQEEEEGLYRASPPQERSPWQDGHGKDNGEGVEQSRFHEVGGAVKRRRLSPEAGPTTPAEDAGLSAGAKETQVVGQKPTPVTPVTPAAGRKKRAGNPFLDEESSEDDDDSDDDKGRDENKENELASATTSRVRSPRGPDSDEYRERDGRYGPSELTSETTISREVPLLRQQTSGTDLAVDDGADPYTNNYDDFEDEDFTGEELSAMRYMEEQARLEAEEVGDDEDGGGRECEEQDSSITERCPVCDGSLVGASPDQATAHVNSCLDGNPTPLPRPPDAVVEAEAAAVGKRFTKAAVARPGQANPIVLADETGKGPPNSAFSKLMSGHAEDAAWATAAAAESASRGMPAYKRTCPFYKIMPGFSICVDAFRYGAVEGCAAYFLSHFHSDHYVGLTANWTHGPIYCSKVTGALVKSQLKTAAKYVVELEFEETVPIPETDGVTVTMIPANHCPGSSLFLFEKKIGGRTQRILHCGDFRACPAHVEHPQLRPETIDAVSGRTKQQKIDVCYLDTTYLNPRYSFPPQSDVIQACADLCASLNKSLLAGDDREWDRLLRRRDRSGPAGAGYPNGTKDVSKFFTTAATTSSSSPSPAPVLSKANAADPGQAVASDAFAVLNGKPHNPNRLLVVCGTYSIGKERICVAIAQALKTKIYAAPGKIRMCRQLDDPELSALLTPDPAAAQVHMQMLMEIRAETLGEYLEGLRVKGCEFGRVVGFRPSGWNYRPSPSASSSLPGSTSAKKIGGASGVNGTGAAAVTANLAPSALATTQLLHGAGWRTRFGARDLVPQRGSSRGALCFGVPYSEHSSFRELGLFLMALRIERVVPTVNVGSEASRRRMKGWIDRWIAERRRGGLVRVLHPPPSSSSSSSSSSFSGAEKEGNGERERLLWDGKDGKGGGVYW